jgi:hypothetical protein
MTMERVGGCGLDEFGSECDIAAGSSQHVNELSMKIKEYPEWLSYFQLLKDYVPLSWLRITQVPLQRVRMVCFRGGGGNTRQLYFTSNPWSEGRGFG